MLEQVTRNERGEEAIAVRCEDCTAKLIGGDRYCRQCGRNTGANLRFEAVTMRFEISDASDVVESNEIGNTTREAINITRAGATQPLDATTVARRNMSSAMRRPMLAASVAANCLLTFLLVTLVSHTSVTPEFEYARLAMAFGAHDASPDVRGIPKLAAPGHSLVPAISECSSAANSSSQSISLKNEATNKSLIRGSPATAKGRQSLKQIDVRLPQLRARDHVQDFDFEATNFEVKSKNDRQIQVWRSGEMFNRKKALRAAMPDAKTFSALTSEVEAAMQTVKAVKVAKANCASTSVRVVARSQGKVRVPKPDYAFDSAMRDQRQTRLISSEVVPEPIDSDAHVISVEDLDARGFDGTR